MDSDGDGYSDVYEIANGSNPKDPSSIPLRALDLNGDGKITVQDAILLYRNRIGRVAVIPPSQSDGDGDGFGDDYEIANGSNPKIPDSIPLGALDLDGDGRITHADAILFYYHQINRIPMIPLAPK